MRYPSEFAIEFHVSLTRDEDNGVIESCNAVSTGGGVGNATLTALESATCVALYASTTKATVELAVRSVTLTEFELALTAPSHCN